MYTINNSAIETLAELNQAIGALTNKVAEEGALPLTTASFNEDKNPTEAEIDKAIKDCTDQVHEYVDVADIITAVNTELATIVADPEGYVLFTYAEFTAYHHYNGLELDDQAKRSLLASAHDDGSSRHQSANCTNPPQGMDWYIHLNGRNTLYAVEDTGEHRGYPKVKVLAVGNVNAGNHNF